mmetsp:Transcript_91195/g.279211  ORF Transcript_91195/g.279211 Transcript_91195/m.279211 type:complete len:365 (-) Transcript_91195:185-1279(-)
MYASDLVVNAHKDEVLHEDVDQIQVRTPQEVRENVQAPVPFAPEDLLAFAERVQAVDRSEQGDAGVRVDEGHGVPRRRVHREIHDRQADSADGHRDEVQQTLIVLPPPRDHHAAPQVLELGAAARQPALQVFGRRRTHQFAFVVRRIRVRLRHAVLAEILVFARLSVCADELPCHLGHPLLHSLVRVTAGVLANIALKASQVLEELVLGDDFVLPPRHAPQQLPDDLVGGLQPGRPGQQHPQLVAVEVSVPVRVDRVPLGLQRRRQHCQVLLRVDVAPALLRPAFAARAPLEVVPLRLHVLVPSLEEHRRLEVCHLRVGDLPADHVHEPLSAVRADGHFEAKVLKVLPRARRLPQVHGVAALAE